MRRLFWATHVLVAVAASQVVASTKDVGVFQLFADDGDHIWVLDTRTGAIMVCQPVAINLAEECVRFSGGSQTCSIPRDLTTAAPRCSPWASTAR
jgi:hypothetical protein